MDCKMLVKELLDILPTGEGKKAKRTIRRRKKRLGNALEVNYILIIHSL